MEDTEYLPTSQRNAYENRNADTATNVEPDPCNEPLGKKEAPGFNTPCCIHIHSFRSRLADSDGVSGKAAIDGLVHAGILQDDSPKYIKEVTFSQEKCKKGQEKTVIYIK